MKDIKDLVSVLEICMQNFLKSYEIGNTIEKVFGQNLIYIKIIVGYNIFLLFFTKKILSLI